MFHATDSPLISPYHAIPDITVPTETGDKLMPTGWKSGKASVLGRHNACLQFLVEIVVSDIA